MRNAGELIRLYTQHDLIEDAIDVSTNLLNSLTSAHYDKFGFEVSNLLFIYEIFLITFGALSSKVFSVFEYLSDINY